MPAVRVGVPTTTSAPSQEAWRPRAPVLKSGWLPAALFLVMVTALEIASGTSVHDVASFAAYAVFALVLPGTLLWRLLRLNHPRPWLEDVVFGAILGYAAEIVVYIAARAVGVPLLVLAWPVTVYAVCGATTRGRAAWRPEGLTRVTAKWAWALAAINAYLVLFIARANWWESGLSADRLRVIGPDASFQLALTGELRHHVPPSVPWVAGEPLHYHWLTYAHMASATWITGIEPIVMLRRLAPLLMAIFVVLAVALIARRLSARPAVGVLAAALLVLVHSPAFYSAEGDHFQRQEFTSQAIFGSPTMTFGLMLFCGVLFLTIEVLRKQPTTRWTWLLLALLLAAASGAKATFAPMMVAGALAVLAIGVLTRSVTRNSLGFFAVTLTIWLAFQFGFYAGESTGFRLTPRGTLEFAADSFGASTPPTMSIAGISLALIIVLLWVVHMAGLLGTLVRGGWRDPLTPFLWGFTFSGVGAALMFDLGLASQQWFVTSTVVAVAVGGAWGFSRLVPPDAARDMVPLAATAALIAGAGMAVSWSLTSAVVPPLGPTLPRLWDYASPFLVAVTVLGALALTFGMLSSKQPRGTVALVFFCAGLTGLGLFRTTQLAVAMTELPWQRAPMPGPASTTIGPGGVEVARWLRAQSQADDVIATNGHTLTPDSPMQTAFWLAGYTERRVLIESWGYTPHHARIMADTGLSFDEVPFWDPDLLELNDSAFTAPTRATLSKLNNNHGVDWLVLDHRFDSDPMALNGLVAPAFSRGDYSVYRIG